MNQTVLVVLYPNTHVDDLCNVLGAVDVSIACLNTSQSVTKGKAFIQHARSKFVLLSNVRQLSLDFGKCFGNFMNHLNVVASLGTCLVHAIDTLDVFIVGSDEDVRCEL